MAPLLLLLVFAQALLAATVTYDFNVTWTTANPDGQFVKRTIGINNKWPLPTIRVKKGDRLVVNVYNGLGDPEGTSIHFHGIFQNGTNFMDGPVMVTQCPIPPGASTTYNFTIDQPGTYWYHSHIGGQYPAGFRGPLIVEDPDGPYADKYDEELVLTLSDWYHEQQYRLSRQFLSYTNPTGAEPVPQAALMNDAQNITFSFEPGKTYMVRMVNMAAFAAQYIWFEEHTMRVIEVDGIYTEPMEASMLYLTAAQRVSVLITAKNSTDKNYAFMGSMDEDLFDQVPAGLNPNVTGHLIYNSRSPKPTAKPIPEFTPLDDFLLTPLDHEPRLPDPDYSFNLDVVMDNLGDGANYAFFNSITYVRPKIPTLYTVLTTGSSATNPAIYGVNAHAYVLPHLDVVEIIVNNRDPGKHPFHLHGHVFQVVYRSEEEAGDYVPGGNITFPKYPMKRDTVLAPPNGHVVLRFRADNPGVWLFHCHLEWHLESGLVATMVEAPEEMQKRIGGKVPEGQRELCREMGIGMEGNAAGNTKDLLDLRGANVSPNRLPDGFTARGIVALTFSILAAFGGVGSVVWYGMGEVSA